MKKNRQLIVCLIGIVMASFGLSHPGHDGEELGASAKYVAGSDIQVVVTIRPTLAFERVSVEIGSNATGGGRVVCELGAVVANQTYRCLLEGDVPDHDPGLVVNITGHTSSSEHDTGIARKSFTITNPTYDRAADQRRQRQIMNQSSRSAILREPTKGEKAR